MFVKTNDIGYIVPKFRRRPSIRNVLRYTLIAARLSSQVETPTTDFGIERMLGLGTGTNKQYILLVIVVIS